MRLFADPVLQAEWELAFPEPKIVVCVNAGCANHQESASHLCDDCLEAIQQKINEATRRGLADGSLVDEVTAMRLSLTKPGRLCYCGETYDPDNPFDESGHRKCYKGMRTVDDGYDL